MFFAHRVVSQTKVSNRHGLPASGFEIKSGERIAFLGNSLFQNDLPYGYLEFVLSTHAADSLVSFRNIGWTGDNVFGDARGDFTNPPTPYDWLIKQLKATRPTLVFVAYGAVEAAEGEEGLPRFEKGLNQLLDTIDKLSSRTVLLSTIPSLAPDTSTALTTQNTNLKLYNNAISTIASQRNKNYINLFDSFADREKNKQLTEDGIHLNERGYYKLACAFEKGLGLVPRKSNMSITLDKQNVDVSAQVKNATVIGRRSGVKFNVDEYQLALPFPKDDGIIKDTVQVLKVNGLKKGMYVLSANGAQVMTASSKKWAEGVVLKQGPAFSQAEFLRDLIVKKNDLYFHQYRPLNKTYIIGFRSYEQGRHKQGLEDLNYIITWLESEIALNRVPKRITYQLTRVK